jgi:hypothetical protein
MSQPPVFTELDGALEQIAIAEKRARVAERALHRLQLQLSEVSEDSPEASEVKQLLELWWREVMDSRPTVAHGLSSTRAAKVRAAIRRRKKIDKANGFEVCRKAVLGVREDDWAMGRVSKSGGRRFNDIAEHILNTDHDIEKFADLYEKRGQKPTPITKHRVREVRQVREDPIEVVLSALTRGGWDWRVAGLDSWVAQCPAHNGTHQHLSFAWNTPGDKLLMKCWSRGCAVSEVCEALGIPVAALFRDELAA